MRTAGSRSATRMARRSRSLGAATSSSARRSVSPLTLYILTLGCPKNRVDSEVMLGMLAQRGYELVADPGAAEVIVVNTCAFIGPAKQESVNAILELAEHKKTGACKALVVTGC